MPIVSSPGSSTVKSSASSSELAAVALTAPNSTTLVDSARYTLPSDGVFSNEKIQRDVFSHATSYNVDRFPDALGLIFGYGEGFPATVTYFNLENPNLLGRANPTDVSNGQQHASHTSYLKILHFELRISEQFDMSYDQETGFMTITGKGYVYPGVKPQKGDLFYYLLNDGQWGVMAVRDIERQSISNGTYHAISFELVKYLTPEYQEYIEAQVTDTAVFDKIKYFTQNYALLKYDSYTTFKALTELRKEIIDYYLDTFHNLDLGSVCRPDGLYDPYVVAFLQSKISITEHRNRPIQLFSVEEDYRRSIWFCLTSRARNNINLVDYKWRIELFKPNFWGSNITSLINRSFIRLGSIAAPNEMPNDLEYANPVDQELPYAGRTEEFYQNTTCGDSFEGMIRAAIIDPKTVNPKLVYECAQNYQVRFTRNPFYDLPFVIHLIDQALFNIKE